MTNRNLKVAGGSFLFGSFASMGIKQPSSYQETERIFAHDTVPSHRSGRFSARGTPPTFTPTLHTPASQHHNDFAERPCRDKEIEARRFFFVPGTCQKTLLFQHYFDGTPPGSENVPCRVSTTSTSPTPTR